MSNIDTNNIIENIKNNVLKSTFFTIKNITKCELTNKYYPDEEENLEFYTLKGANAVNRHHCYGNIIYHKNNKEYLKYADMFYECYEKIIQKHSLQGLNVNIFRSSGKIENVHIPNEAPLKYFDDSRGLCVFVEILKNRLWKWVSFLDGYDKSNKKNIPGLINLNRDLFKESKLVIFYNVCECSLKEYRQEYLDWTIKNLKKLDINYEIEYNKI